MTVGTVANKMGIGKDNHSWSPVVLGAVIVIVAALVTVLVSLRTGESESTSGEAHVSPATVEHVAGSDIARITLTERAAQRLDIQTAETTMQPAAGGQGLVVPYASLIYDAEGGTWTYTNPEPLVFERAAVTVDSVDGNRVFLSEGPPAGTPVVVVGAAELFGAEFGVGH